MKFRDVLALGRKESKLKNLEYEKVPVNLYSGKQHDDASRAINPQRLVPSLIDGDLTLIQSTAIIEYLL